MRKPAVFLLGGATAFVLAGPIKWVAKQLTILALKAKRQVDVVVESAKEDIQDIEAEYDARKGRKPSSKASAVS
jgi:F0F1-type ATP synthase epsilon subunit